MKTDNLTFYRIPLHTDAWYRFRTTGLTKEDAKQYNCPVFTGGVGSSEIATILRHPPSEKARPIIQDYYHWKLGTIIPDNETTELMIGGLEDEERIKNRWRCYAGENDFIDRYWNWYNAPPNEKSKYIIRNAKRINAYIVNKKYPWLFSSFDFWAEKNSHSFDGIIKLEGFPLETKSTSYFYIRNFEDQFPDSFNIQVHQEMIISESDYAEVGLLVDRRFRCIPVERNEKLCNWILEKSYEFWQTVLKGREYLVERNKALEKNNIEEFNKFQAYIDSLEPLPDDNPAYEDLIKERHVQDIEMVKGSIEDYKNAKLYDSILEYEKLLGSKKQFAKNLLLKKLDDNNAGQIDFDKLGKVTHIIEGKKTNPTFRVSLKESVNKKSIKEEFDKINFNKL
jgi:hypothetical protein